MTPSNFRETITETGILTTKGKEIANKTLIAGLDAFFKELGSEELTLSQRQLVKTILVQLISENISYRAIN
jgi:hypothetical protein